jgi:tetratricopeptide (TPR) repeat protein
VLALTGEPNSSLVNAAAKELGNRLSGKDDRRVADYWQRMLLSTLKPSASLPQADDYLRVAHMTHRLRARGELAAGNPAQAAADARRAMNILPDEAISICDLVPRFDAAGNTEVADELFEGTYGHMHRTIENHPQAAGQMNNLAWMAAVCGRRLDEAHEFSRRANELSPDNPVYLDTLAEVQFQRDNVAEAVELARRCIELDGENDHYREQLARFQKP